jgi:hypothetical protein
MCESTEVSSIRIYSGILFICNYLLFVLISSFEISGSKLDGQECSVAGTPDYSIDLGNGLYASHFYNKVKLNISPMHIVLTTVSVYYLIRC